MRISDWSSDVCSSDLSGRIACDVANKAVEPVDAGEGQLDLLDQLGPVGGRHQLAAITVEQVEADLRLELRNDAADRGLRQRQLLACRGRDRKSTRLNSSH